jgi:large subunit ribosomal protein L9
MEIILLERVRKLGQMGETVRVKDGYARNFLFPRGKALRATESNKEKFQAQRAQLEVRNLESKKEAQAAAEKLQGQSVVLIRQAGETGMLYGSVAARDIADALTAQGASVARQQIVLNTPIKKLGVYTLPISLHADVEVEIQVNVARSAQEAEKQARGEQTNVREETNYDELGLDIGGAINEDDRAAS